ncbi:hypothetical protein D9615_002472 [Tricholomella constricta]|uniref:Uncharacterized protein n=1 Tax=Tricholomella constricta TaxID=117010 RepID=A0A8H5HMM9_9AGAR|nr:hypothetical protein D9615_002472 [Tricholomella constricta]
MPVMTASRIPESQPRSKLRSLLQTRSLRDLQATPPPLKPPIPEKSRRRVLQVNGPYVVREVCPPMPEPSQAEMLQAPYVRSQSPPSMQVSPFIAATRTSFDSGPSRSISPYTQNRTHHILQSNLDNSTDTRTRRSVTGTIAFPDGATPQGLRNPPVDPRKTRRYCTDFGLGRDESTPSMLTPPSPSLPVYDNSSLASTPLAMYTETETDSDTSSADHTLEFSFPQPPLIDESESLRLRRMHSSPMFSSQETDAVKDFLRKRWGAVQVSMSKGLPTPYDQWAGVGDFFKDSSQNMDHEGEFNFSLINRVTTESSPQGSRENPQSLTSSLTRDRKLSTPTAFPTSSKLENDASWKRATTAPTLTRDREFQSEGTSLSHTRPSYSAWKETNTAATPSQRSVQLPFEVSKPLDRLDISIEKLKAHDPRAHQINRAAAVPWEYQSASKPQPSLPISPPSLASAGRQKPTHRSNISVPLAGLGLADVNNIRTGSPKSLGAPFNHRSTRSHAVIRVPTNLNQEPMPKSFIDITPEQDNQRGTSGIRMRKLLARASVGVLEWGKGLVGKKNVQ